MEIKLIQITVEPVGMRLNILYFFNSYIKHIIDKNYQIFIKECFVKCKRIDKI